jgi:sorbitol-specific phosphotransferase system component IIBC
MIDKTLTSNSPPAIQQRVQAGRIGWAGPLVLTTARTALILLVQAVVAVAFLVQAILRHGVLKRLGGRSTPRSLMVGVLYCSGDRRGGKESGSLTSSE